MKATSIWKHLEIFRGNISDKVKRTHLDKWVYSLNGTIDFKTDTAHPYLVVSSSDIWAHGDECYLDDNISATVCNVLYIGLLCSTWQCLLSSSRDMKSFTIQHLTLTMTVTAIINAVPITLAPYTTPLRGLIIEEARKLLNVVRKIQNVVYFFLSLIVNWDSCLF